MRKFLLPALLLPLCFLLARNPQQDPQGAPAPPKKARRPPPPGVWTPGVKREISAIKPDAVFPIEGAPDWQVVTDDAVWVTNSPKNTVHRLDPKTNKVLAAVTVGRRPCSGLAAGFGTVWVAELRRSVGRGQIGFPHRHEDQRSGRDPAHRTGAKRRRRGYRRG